MTLTGFATSIILSGDQLEARILQDSYIDELNDIKTNLEKGTFELPQSSHVKAYWGTSGTTPSTFIKYGEGDYHDIVYKNHNYHLYVTAVNNDLLYIALKIDVIENYEERLKQLVLIATFSFIALCVWLSWWLTQFIASPISQFATAVSNLSAEDNLLHATSDPELGIIEKSINEYIKVIQQALRREKQFSGMASHELRTPLATILATLETLQEDRSFNEKQLARIHRITRSVHELQFISESLLTTIKHSQAIKQSEEINLSTVIEQTVNEYKNLHPQQTINFEHSSTERICVDQNPSFIRIIIGNLIRNSVNHNLNCAINVTLSRKAISVNDNGTGLPDNILNWINSQAEIPYEDMGLGLHIVKTLCEKMNWHLSASKNTVIVHYSSLIQK